LTNKNQDKVSSYIAGEYLFSDGAFESPQNFNRVNLTGKYTNQISEFENLELTASYFTSEWTASGQVPMRSIENGSISRFGAIELMFY
jgi:hypothetical protein